ncbi:MAG TPA: AI-2E family transporter [Caulobacteraceae bacterium]|jgi:predicted PurR-regulated permease PerM|nr:AI-2E family transporter [Caulobacteraceae bacterium]
MTHTPGGEPPPHEAHHEPHHTHGHDYAYAVLQSRQLGRIATSASVLAIIATIISLWLLRNLLTPLIVAVFLMILIDSVSRQVARVAPWTPEWMRVSAGFVLMLLLIALAATVSVRSVHGFALELGAAKYKLLTMVDSATAQLPFSIASADTMLHSIDVKAFVFGVLGKAGHLTESTLLGAIYLGFLLASRAAFRHKVELLFPDKQSRGHAQRVIQRVRQSTEDYIGLQTLKAVVLAVIAWGIMAAFGLHNAIFLAFLILLVAYIPIIGPAAAVVVPTVLAILQFDMTWRPLALYVLLQGLVVALDSVLLPRMQAEKLDVDPVVVLLSLGFWSLIFGVTGALLSTPLTVIVIAIAGETQSLRWLAIMLSKGARKAELVARETEPATP